MEDLVGFAQDWGAITTALVALALALRTHARSSASTIEQLQTWLREAQAEIKRLRDRIQQLEADCTRLAAEVERLMPYQRRAESLAAELRRREREDMGAAHRPAPTRYREGPIAEVVQFPTTAATSGEET